MLAIFHSFILGILCPLHSLCTCVSFPQPRSPRGYLYLPLFFKSLLVQGLTQGQALLPSDTPVPFPCTVMRRLTSTDYVSRASLSADSQLGVTTYSSGGKWVWAREARVLFTFSSALDKSGSLSFSSMTPCFSQDRPTLLPASA